MIWLRAGVMAAASAILSAVGPATALAATVEFRHVAVLPMDREVLLADQAVVVRDGRIVSVAPDKGGPAAAHAQVIDGRGKVLTPGLVDFHVHPNAPGELISFVKFGVTTIAAFDAEPLVWRREGVKLPEIRPNIVSTTTILDGDPPTNRRRYVMGAPGDAAAILDHEIASGAVMTKVYNAFREPEFSALAAESHRRGLPVVGHIPSAVPPSVLFSGHGLDLVAHGEEFLQILPETATDPQIEALVGLIVSHHVAVNPDLVAVFAIPGLTLHLSQALADPRMAYMPSSMYQEWQARSSYASRPNPQAFAAGMGPRNALQARIVRKLRAAGAEFVGGTDAPDTCFAGDCVQEELGLLVGEAGFSNYEALAAFTANPGRFVAERIHVTPQPRFGVVAPGARADLLLLDGDPVRDLAALRRIEGVMVAGRWRPQKELTAARDALLPDLQRGHAAVDRYEALFAAQDFPGLFAFLDSLPTGAAPLFGDDVIPGDAVRLDRKGDTAHGLQLLEHARRLMPATLGVYHPLGALRLKSGDVPGSRAAYEAALKIAPRDATALKGLAQAREKGA